MRLKEFQKLLLTHVLSVYVFCLVFDIIVSYSIYSTHSEYFFNQEQNEELIKIVRLKEIPYMLIMQSAFMFFLPTVFYLLEMKFNRDIFNYLLLIAITITLCGAMMHLQGGLSWWRL